MLEFKIVAVLTSPPVCCLSSCGAADCCSDALFSHALVGNSIYYGILLHRHRGSDASRHVKQ
jgi:hypothetical protein